MLLDAVDKGKAYLLYFYFTLLYIRRLKDVLDVFWTSYVFSVYVLSKGYFIL